MNDHDLARRCRDRMYDADRASRGLGIRVEVTAAGSASTSMAVREDMVNGLDVCHGGYVFTLADTAFAFACNGYDDMTLAAGASIEFLAPARTGDRLQATATERHRGRRSGVYDVVVTNQDGREVAVFRGRARTTGRPLLG